MSLFLEANLDFRQVIIFVFSKKKISLKLNINII
jgi:hypothetical protein